MPSIRRLVYATALASGFCLVLLLGDEWGVLLQYLIGKLAYSTSNGAALYLILFLTLAAWCCRLPISQRATGFTWFVAFLALGHLLNLWLTLRYLAEMGIPLGAHVYHWQDAAYSFTGLFHSHLGKTAFAIVAGQLGWHPLGYDDGSVFLNWVPVWAACGIALSFVGGLVAALMSTPEITHGRHLARAILYMLAAALSLRGMIDGGPLAPGVFPAFVALIYCRLMGSRAEPRLVFGLISLLLSGYIMLWIALSPGQEIPALGSLLFPLALFVWLAIYERGCGYRSARALLMGLLAAILLLDSQASLLPLLLQQGTACRHYTVTENLAGKGCFGESAYRIYRMHAEDPRKPKYSLIAPELLAGSHQLSARLLVLETVGSEVRLEPNGYWRDLRLLPFSLQGGWLALLAVANPALPPVLAIGEPNVLIRNNFSVYLWELARNLQQSGVREFILFPETRGNGSWADN